MKSKYVKHDMHPSKVRISVDELYILKALSKQCIRLCTPSSIPCIKEG